MYLSVRGVRKGQSVNQHPKVGVGFSAVCQWTFAGFFFLSPRFSTRRTSADTICRVFFCQVIKGAVQHSPSLMRSILLVSGPRDVGVGLAVIGPNSDASFNSYTHSFRG